MWFSSYIYIFMIMLYFKTDCSAQDECFSGDDAPGINVINDTTVEVTFSNKTANITQIEYGRIANLECSDSKNDTRKIAKSYIINDLHPFSDYEGEIRYYKIGIITGQSCVEKISFKTPAAATFGSNEVPRLSHKYSETEATVTVEWPCERLRGHIQHSITVTCRSYYCTSRIVEYGETIQTIWSFKIYFKIDKQTRYVVTLKYWRDTDIHSMDYEVPINLLEPPPIQTVIAYNLNDTSASLRWLPPADNIELYEMSYYGFEDEKVVTINASSKCKIWPDYVCVTVNDEEFLNQGYTYEIRAKLFNINRFGKYRVFTTKPNRTRVPSAPLNINYVWKDEDNLKIEWQHPDEPNGQIIYFNISINNEFVITYNVTTESLNYEDEINTSDFNFTSNKLLIGIMAANKIGYSSKGLSWHKKLHFSELPTIENVTDSSFNISIPTVLDVEGDISKMYVVITDTESPVPNAKLHPREAELFKEIKVEKDFSWIIGEFDLDNVTQVTVGDNSMGVSELDGSWTFSNGILEDDRLYYVTIILSDTLFGTTKIETYTLNCTTLNSTSTDSDESGVGLDYLWSLLLIPVLLGVVCAIILKRKRQQGVSLIRKLIFCDFCDDYASVSNIYSVPIIPRATDRINIYDKIVLSDRDFIRVVKIQELDQYVKNNLQNDELTKQYKLLPQTPMKLYDEGNQLANRAKHRYPNLVAYDSTRVKLDVIDGEPFSDYINANYIDGYNTKQAYIATQTPTDNTYGDFWRMIWQEKVKYIIIASDLNEEEQEKGSGIYWPDLSNNLDIGKITVVYKSIEVMANYEIRHFTLFCEHQVHEVEQLHFFSMPDYSSVPLYIHSFGSFIRKVYSISGDKSPIVVHCSDGISYTGMVILCDICLRMASSEGQMDILYQLFKLRKQRINMVSSVEQYKAVHFILLRILECIKIPNETGIICDKSMEQTVEDVLITKIEKQVKYLEESSWQDDAMRDIEFLYNCIKSNRKLEQGDSTSNQVYRYSTIGDKNLFITTTIVDSFTTPSKFVVTSKPLKATLGPFWQFIIDKRIHVIVCLNKMSLIPDLENTFNPLPTLEVTCVNHKVTEHFEVYTLYANGSTNKKNKVRINIIHVLEWPSSMFHPLLPINLIMAYEEMNRLGKSGKSIMITCHDGIQACGLYVAMCFLIEKIKTEQICDVCLAVKSVRHSRKDYVRNIGQFRFLYLCALEYVRRFKMYSNFDSSMKDEQTNFVESNL